jgi:pimeloyl-ACP methyl ester carboxylesterase
VIAVHAGFLLLALAALPAPALAQAHEPAGEEVAIPVAGGLELAGTLLSPGGAGPFPGALLVPGGSPFDRDETAFGKQPFRALAEALCAEGFAVLRVDDRGVGGSGGDKLGCSLEELAGDASACLAWLAARPGVDARRLALVGHSQGALVAARACARPGGPAALVLLGAPGLPVDEILARQLALDGHGALEENLAMVALARGIRGFGPAAQAELGTLWKDRIAGLPEDARAAAADFRSRLEPQVASMLGARLLRESLFLDPRPDLAAARCPVLLVVGERDEPMLLGLPEALRALSGRPGADTSVRVVPGVNHMLLEHADPDPRTWAQADHDLSPAVSRTVRAWLREVLADPVGR